MAKKVQLTEEEVRKQEEERRTKLLMDSMLEEIKMYQAQADETNTLAKMKIDEIKLKANTKVQGFEKEIERLKQEVMVLYKKVPKSETKVQFKVGLICGDIVVKKAYAKLDYDKEKLLNYANEKVTKYLQAQRNAEALIEELETTIEELVSNPETPPEKILNLRQKVEELEYERDRECEWFDFVKNKTTTEFDWAAFKEKLEILESEDEEHNKTYAIVKKDDGEILEIDGLGVAIEPEKVVIQL